MTTKNEQFFFVVAQLDSSFYSFLQLFFEQNDLENHLLLHVKIRKQKRTNLNDSMNGMAKWWWTIIVFVRKKIVLNHSERNSSNFKWIQSIIYLEEKNINSFTFHCVDVWMPWLILPLNWYFSIFKPLPQNIPNSLCDFVVNRPNIFFIQSSFFS